MELVSLLARTLNLLNIIGKCACSYRIRNKVGKIRTTPLSVRMHKKLFHSIVNMRANDPTTRITIRIYDLIAYQQQQLSDHDSIQLATEINWKGTFYILISLRLTFGGLNGTSEWRTIKGPIIYHRSALLLDKTWEQKETQSPNQDSITRHQPRISPSCSTILNPYQSKYQSILKER